MIYPWHQQQFDLLENNYKNNKLAKVILLYGASGVGKTIFAQSLAELILDNNCSSDLIALGQDSSLKIDDVRSLIDAAHKSAYNNNNKNNSKVFVIHNTDQLNTNSANALLKILESESLSNYFILVSNSINKVLPTILSRSFKINLNIADNNQYQQAISWLNSNNITDDKDINFLLELSDNGPIRALDLYNNNFVSIYNSLTAILNNLSDARFNKLVSAANNINLNYINNKKDNISLKDLLLLMNYYFYHNNYSSNKNLYYIINTYNKYLSANISLDSFNVIYNILYCWANNKL